MFDQIFDQVFDNMFDPSFDLEAVHWSRTYRSTLKALTNFKGVKQYEI